LHRRGDSAGRRGEAHGAPHTCRLSEIPPPGGLKPRATGQGEIRALNMPRGLGRKSTRGDVMADKILVLLVEDDSADAELITRALAKALPGVEVEHAKTSAEYLQRLAAGGFDAIISDSSMPGAEGMTALHLARERHPNIPFIYLSGAEDPNRDQRGLEALGVSGLLTKARLDELSPTLQRSVESSRENPDSGLTDRYELLVDAVRELSLARDLPAIMAIVRHAARRLTGADGATFVLREGDLCHYADEDAIGPLWKGRKFPMNSCISGWAMKNRQPAVVEDIHSDPRI